MSEADRIWVDYLPLSEIRRLAENPKDHDIGELHGSMDRFGYTAPMTIDERSGNLVAGYGRLETLEQKKAGGESPPNRIVMEDGEWKAPVIRGISFNSDAELRAYVIADNRLTELGGWKQDVLVSELARLYENDTLDGTGFDAEDLDRLSRDLQQESDTEVNLTDERRLKPGERFEQQYNVTALRQIVLIMSKEEYQQAVEMLQTAREAYKLETNAEVVLQLLTEFTEHGA